MSPVHGKSLNLLHELLHIIQGSALEIGVTPYCHSTLRMPQCLCHAGCCATQSGQDHTTPRLAVPDGQYCLAPAAGPGQVGHHLRQQIFGLVACWRLQRTKQAALQMRLQRRRRRPHPCQLDSPEELLRAGWQPPSLGSRADHAPRAPSLCLTCCCMQKTCSMWLLASPSTTWLALQTGVWQGRRPRAAGWAMAPPSTHAAHLVIAVLNLLVHDLRNVWRVGLHADGEVTLAADPPSHSQGPALQPLLPCLDHHRGWHIVPVVGRAAVAVVRLQGQESVRPRLQALPHGGSSAGSSTAGSRRLASEQHGLTWLARRSGARAGRRGGRGGRLTFSAMGLEAAPILVV